MVPIDRSCVDDHFLAHRDASREFAAPQPNVITEYLVTVLGRPDQLVFAVPDRVATALVVLQLLTLPSIA